MTAQITVYTFVVLIFIHNLPSSAKSANAPRRIYIVGERIILRPTSYLRRSKGMDFYIIIGRQPIISAKIDLNVLGSPKKRRIRVKG